MGFPSAAQRNSETDGGAMALTTAGSELVGFATETTEASTAMAAARHSLQGAQAAQPKGSSLGNPGATRSLSSDGVQKLLRDSLSALMEAPNRALKRRVRQRLHKKLGCMLGQKDFEEAMNLFKSMEDRCFRD
eukprot:Skav221587  [mRNA]  locus=scaffold1698:136364:140038:+ [translate_table: standard]